MTARNLGAIDGRLSSNLVPGKSPGNEVGRRLVSFPDFARPFCFRLDGLRERGTARSLGKNIYVGLKGHNYLPWPTTAFSLFLAKMKKWKKKRSDYNSTKYFKRMIAQEVKSENMDAQLIHFRVSFDLCFKTSPGAQPFIWKWTHFHANQTHFHFNGFV